MDFIEALLQSEAGVAVLAVAIWNLLNAIAKLTPTNVDNDIIDTLRRLFGGLFKRQK